MSSNADRKSVLVLGGPNTGKSHYAFQLFGRLRLGGGNIELRKTPDSVSLFEAGLERLNQGLAAAHTSTNTYLECTLPLKLADRNLDVCWPDYDGEQLYRQVTHRRVTKNWQSRLQSADAWLLFVRLAITRRHKDILADPLEAEIPCADEPVSEDWANPAKSDELSGQAKLIELLQILLHVSGADISLPTRSPVLGVVVSCWDEVCSESGVVPDDLLSKQAPLIHQFLHANWNAQSRFVVGLSSTGKPLSEKNPDNDYKEKGPESFGYSINADGEKNADLTVPISMLLNFAESNES